MMTNWPKGLLIWDDADTRCISVPFTWLLPDAKQEIIQGSLFPTKRIRVGGPAVKLMPEYLAGLGADVGGDIPGVLQRFNPQATMTTRGCPRKCGFCAVPKTEGDLIELPDWLDLPIICDNNILRASDGHFNRVCDRLERHGWGDFNQGLDARLLKPHHAERLKRIGKVMCRLALDHAGIKDAWETAYGILRNAGIAKSLIRSYVIVGFKSDPADAWDRCEWVESHGVKALPMWYHPLDSLSRNRITEEQMSLGWSNAERLRIMRWYYKHSGERGPVTSLSLLTVEE